MEKMFGPIVSEFAEMKAGKPATPLLPPVATPGGSTAPRPAVPTKGFYPAGGAPEPRPSMVYPVPKVWWEGKIYEGETPGRFEGMFDPLTERLRSAFPPAKTEAESIFKWRPAPQSMAPTMPITPPTATGMTPTRGGGGEAPCPPGQFRPAPGAPCRGSVGAMPGIPGGLAPSGGTVPVAAPYLGGRRIVRGGFGQSLWT
jgi:hypothetical protein